MTRFIEMLLSLILVEIAYLTKFSSLAFLTVAREQWVEKADFTNLIPATLTPIFEITVKMTAECFFYCNVRSCSSVAYSAAYQSCKLYSHPNFYTPLPALKADPYYRHQMYYKKRFCPPGWEADAQTENCYLIGPSASLRPDAWQVCEENLASTLVTFQTPLQRDNLYSILRSKYSSINKFWTGYAMFDSLMWPRPIEEIPGYIRRRGDCFGNNIGGNVSCSFDECIKLCSVTYHDKCVGFSFSGVDSICRLKTRSCDNPTGNIFQDIWIYDKIPSWRPPAHYFDSFVVGYDIKQYADISREQCNLYCLSFPHCVHYTYHSMDRRCWLKYKAPSTRNNTLPDDLYSHDIRETKPGPCPFGVRYRDFCLVYHQTPATFSIVSENCRKLGGKLITPSETQKHSYIYAIMNSPNANLTMMWIDYTDEAVEGQWRTGDMKAVVSQPPPWGAGEQNGGTGENCASMLADGQYSTTWSWSNSSGNGYMINDGGCSWIGNAICESPISVSWPKNCRFTPTGSEYAGSLSQTINGVACKQWSTTPQSSKLLHFPDQYNTQAYCRNPDSAVFNDSVWCYRNDNSAAERCSVPMCPETDWAAGQSFTDANNIYAAITYDAGVADEYDWTTEPATTLANPVCTIKMDDWCPYYFQGSCYMTFEIPANHDEAGIICAKNGWHLMTITSLDEQHFALQMTQNAGNQRFVYANGYHIGLKRQADGSWKWDNGEALVATYWSAGQPNNGADTDICGMLYGGYGDGYWHDYFCWFKEWFICEIELAK